MALNLCSNQAASFKMKEVKDMDGMFSKGKLVSWTVRNDFEAAGVCRTCIKQLMWEALEKLLDNCWDEDISEIEGMEAVVLTGKRLMLHVSVIKARRRTWEEEL